MDFGLNPILTAYQSWESDGPRRGTSSEFQTYGVTGTKRVLRVQKVTVRAGTFTFAARSRPDSSPGPVTSAWASDRDDADGARTRRPVGGGRPGLGRRPCRDP